MSSDDERSRLGALLASLVPGSAPLGAVAYVEQLLTALDHDPPRALGRWRKDYLTVRSR